MVYSPVTPISPVNVCNSCGECEDDCHCEEVYMVTNASEFCGEHEHLQTFKEDTIYYQTYGGGPEGGYFVQNGVVYEVHRNWGTPFMVKLIECAKLTYTPADEMNGICASVSLMYSDE